MRLSIALVTATLLTGSLAGCTSGLGVPQSSPLSTDGSAQMRFTTGRSRTANVVPVELRSSVVLAKIHQPARIGDADAVTPGIYGGLVPLSSGYIYAYPDPDNSNGPPVCKVGPIQVFDALAVDRKGDLLVATGSYPTSPNFTITIFKGPGLCGPKLGSINDPYGWPVDVASRDAQSGEIVVPTERSNREGGPHGGVAVCTLSGGCTRLLRSTRVPHVTGGVAVAPNGDCWAWGWRGVEVLSYYAQCRHKGVATTALTSPAGAYGVDIDGHGNLVVTVDHNIYIYSGCNPACKFVGGPFTLTHAVPAGFHLDASSKHLVAAVLNQPELDVYSYSPSAIKYEYSITNGLMVVAGDAAAFSPSSKE